MEEGEEGEWGCRVIGECMNMTVPAYILTGLYDKTPYPHHRAIYLGSLVQLLQLLDWKKTIKSSEAPHGGIFSVKSQRLILS